MNLTKRIEKLEDQLAIGSTETPLQAITRRQANLIFYYSHTNVPQEAMVAFAKQNGNTSEEERDNLRIFTRLVDEATNGRKFTAVQGGLR